jgi:hypothetical protein
VRSVLLAAILALVSFSSPARADDACAHRAAALRLIFAAAGAGEPLAAVRAPLAAALAAATEDHAALRCPPLALAVDELRIPAGETRVVPGGTRIVAANGAAVLGLLAALGAGGVTVATVLGDLVLEGAIDADAVRLEARSGNVRVGSRFAAPPSADVHVAAAAGAILFAPRDAGAPEPFPADAELVAFHLPSPAPRRSETELTGR